MEQEFSEEITEFNKATESLKSWSIDDWRVETQYQLDIEKYAQKKGKTLVNSYEKVIYPYK